MSDQDDSNSNPGRGHCSSASAVVIKMQAVVLGSFQTKKPKI